MNPLIPYVQNGIMYGCIAALMVILGFVFCRFLGESGKKFCRSIRNIGIVGLTVISIVYGGSKSIMSKTSTDDDIELLDAAIEVSNVVETVEGEVQTNFYSRTLVIKVAEGSSAPTPVWFRESVYQTWTNANTLATFTTDAPAYYADESGNGTNVYKWLSYDWTNSVSHRFWYIGTDLPAVQVDVEDDDYIIIDEFLVTSSRVRIQYHLNASLEYPEGSVIQIQRSINRKAWETVEEVEASAYDSYEYTGFTVGKDTRWRLHMAITVDDDE